MQVGGSVGIALLSTILASAKASYVRVHPGAGAAAVHGDTTGFAWAAALFAIGLLVSACVLPPKPKGLAVKSVPERTRCSPRRAQDLAVSAVRRQAASHQIPSSA